MKPWPAIRIPATIMLMLLLLIGVLSGTFFLTALLYRTIGYTPFPLLIQLINSLLGGLIYFLLIGSVISLINARLGARGARRWQMEVFEPIIEALGRIAKGDFQVRLPHDAGANTFTSELAQSVNQMAQELNQMEHLRQEFIANVSHEIQSPLTSIRGFTQALHDELLSAEQRQHYLGIIEMESTRLSRMTDNMLKLAALEAAHMEIELRSYRLDKQIRTLILACEPQWTSKAIEMEATLEEIVIEANEDLLGQVWSNLLLNSIKFTPQGGKVYVEACRRDNRIECSITDTGIGIPQEAQARIFERFYKMDMSRERGEGSGLGLAIARKIVELHRGTIGIVSQEGVGTSITVALPAEQVHSSKNEHIERLDD